MSTPDALAKAAREKLAIALNALQTSADPPLALLDLAEPIAQTMGILHRIERSRGADLEGRETIVANIRKALDMLQNMSDSHPAVDAVMEQVAGCLSSAHQLARLGAPSSPGGGPVPKAQPTAPGGIVHPAPIPAAAPVPVAAAPIPVAAAPVVPVSPVAQMVANIPPPQPMAQSAQPPHGLNAAMNLAMAATTPNPQPSPVIHQGPSFPAAPAVGPNHTLRIDDGQAIREAARARQAQPANYAQPAHHPQPAPMQPVPQAQAAPAYSQQAAPAPQAYQAPQAYAQQPARSTPVTPPQASQPPARGQQGSVVCGLGAHSVSNFYKGLGGNDVIEYGGLFVSTYQIPKIGTPVNLLVKLPGDLEFQASGVVQWIREASGDGVDPGFGARFTQITPEGRQLVYRYTRNREPILYDDL